MQVHLEYTWVKEKGPESSSFKLSFSYSIYDEIEYADDSTLTAESEEELKSFLKVKEESEKVGLKLNIQKTKIMVPSVHGKQMGKQWK